MNLRLFSATLEIVAMRHTCVQGISNLPRAAKTGPNLLENHPVGQNTTTSVDLSRADFDASTTPSLLNFD